jgi:hypothetical protein
MKDFPILTQCPPAFLATTLLMGGVAVQDTMAKRALLWGYLWQLCGLLEAAFQKG